MTESEVNLFEIATPLSSVCRFVISVCKKMFCTKDFLGSNKNISKFLSAVNSYMNLGRGENLTIDQLTSKIKTTCIPFMAQASFQLNTQPKNILRAFIYWIFTEFINPLVAVCFYVTEGEGHGSQLLFYRKPVWSVLMKMGKKQLNLSFSQLPPSDNSNKQYQDVPLVRFVPKKKSLRPITNMNVRSRRPLTKKFINSPQKSSLYNLLNVLRKLSSENPSLIGFGAFGLDDIYEKIKSFRRSPAVLDALKSGPGNLYIAAVDIEKCFDNINTRILYNVVRDLLRPKRNQSATQTPVFYAHNTVENDDIFSTQEESPNESLIHRYSVVHKINSMEKVFTKNLRILTSPGDLTPFSDAAHEISANYHDAVISDYVVYPTVSTDEMLDVLRTHLFNHVVNFSCDGQSSFYTQIKGIPQGSILSPLLCNLYYGHLESSCFGSAEQIQKVGLDGRTLIIRLMDDYFAVSVDKDCIFNFLSTMYLQFKTFGATVNPDKSRVNFDCSFSYDGSMKVVDKILDNSKMPWCGLLVDTNKLEISPDFSRILGNKLSSSISVDFLNRGLSLRRCIKSFFRTKCHAIFLDKSINSRVTVLKSIYNSFLVTSLRADAYLKRLGSNFHMENSSYILRCIIEAVDYGSRLVRSRTMRKKHASIRLGTIAISDCKTGKQLTNFGKCTVSRIDSFRLGLIAFLTMMRATSRHSRYSKVVRELEYKYSKFVKTITNEDLSLILKCNDLLLLSLS